MSKTEFLQADLEYRELSKAVQEWASNGTQEEQEALSYFFEKALRQHEGLSYEPNTVIEKGLQDTITYSRFEEIKQTTTDFVERLFEIVNGAINRTFAAAEVKYMQELEDRLKELEEHGLDDMIEQKLAGKEVETERVLRKTIGIDNEVHLSNLNRELEKLKKRGRLCDWTT